jgi:hypothetical protein
MTPFIYGIIGMFFELIFLLFGISRQRIPEVVHSLRMSKERITAIHLPFQSKWLIVGTDKAIKIQIN